MIINLTKNTFIDLSTEWEQLSGCYNWYTITFVECYFENDKFTGGYEWVVCLFGCRLRIRHNTKRYYELEKAWKKEIEKEMKKKKKKKKATRKRVATK